MKNKEWEKKEEPEVEDQQLDDAEETREQIPSEFNKESENKPYRIPMGYDPEIPLTDEQKKF